jgi:hypothetical protein
VGPFRVSNRKGKYGQKPALVLSVSIVEKTDRALSCLLKGIGEAQKLRPYLRVFS